MNTDRIIEAMNTRPTPRTDAEHERICELWWGTDCDYDKMKDFSCQIERELATVTEQRDKAREIYQKSYTAELARVNHYKQQQYRLAEALKETISSYDVVTESIPSLCSDYVHNVIDPLLAAVKGGSE